MNTSGIGNKDKLHDMIEQERRLSKPRNITNHPLVNEDQHTIQTLNLDPNAVNFYYTPLSIIEWGRLIMYENCIFIVDDKQINDVEQLTIRSINTNNEYIPESPNIPDDIGYINSYIANTLKKMTPYAFKLLQHAISLKHAIGSFTAKCNVKIVHPDDDYIVDNMIAMHVYELYDETITNGNNTQQNKIRDKFYECSYRLLGKNKMLRNVERHKPVIINTNNTGPLMFIEAITLLTYMKNATLFDYPCMNAYKIIDYYYLKHRYDNVTDHIQSIPLNDKVADPKQSVTLNKRKRVRMYDKYTGDMGTLSNIAYEQPLGKYMYNQKILLRNLENILGNNLM